MWRPTWELPKVPAKLICTSNYHGPSSILMIIHPINVLQPRYHAPLNYTLPFTGSKQDDPPKFPHLKPVSNAAMARKLCPVVALILGATTTLAVDNSWHPPESSAINDLDRNLDSDGVFGFIFDSSLTPDDRYGQYNYCNMPHIRKREYTVAPDEYELVYVEMV